MKITDSIYSFSVGVRRCNFFGFFQSLKHGPNFCFVDGNESSLTHYLYASWLSVGSVYATYYTTSDGGVTFSAPTDVIKGPPVAAATKKITAGVSNDVIGYTPGLTTSAVGGPWGTSGLGTGGTDNAYIIRWNGLYSPNSATQMFFQWSGSSVPTDRVKLWVDNKLVIDQWSSLATTAPSAGYLFDSTSGIYDIHLEYFRTVASSASALPKLQEGTSSSAYSQISTSRLFSSENLSGSPYAVIVST